MAQEHLALTAKCSKTKISDQNIPIVERVESEDGDGCDG